MILKELKKCTQDCLTDTRLILCNMEQTKSLVNVFLDLAFFSIDTKSDPSTCIDILMILADDIIPNNEHIMNLLDQVCTHICI